MAPPLIQGLSDFVDHISLFYYRYVLKVMNANETFFRGESTLDGTDECIMYLHGAIGKHVEIPMPQKTTNGTYKKLVCVPTKRSCLADEFINAAEELAIKEGLLDLESASEDKKRNIMQVPHYIRFAFRYSNGC